MTDVDDKEPTSPEDYGITDAVDIGSGMKISPYQDGDGNVIGMHTWHQCLRVYTAGSVMFDTELTRTKFPNSPKWQVHSMDPLTITPSVLCRTCGNHGYITNGEWKAC